MNDIKTTKHNGKANFDEHVEPACQVERFVIPFRHLDLFSGIGGFALAVRNVFGDGHEIIGFCEINEWCQKLLRKRFPNIPIHLDVKTLGVDKIEGSIDIITGGFPCQDLSFAGKTRGIEEERSGLWKEFKRIIGEVRPKWVLVENVSALLTGDNGTWFRTFLTDISEIGYNAEWHCLQAADIGSPHRRDRVWIVAYPSSDCFINDRMGDTRKISKWIQDTKDREKDRFKYRLVVEKVAPEKWIYKDESFTRPLLVRNDDGIPYRMDRLIGLGNAIVPQVAEVFLRRIKEIEIERTV